MLETTLKYGISGFRSDDTEQKQRIFGGLVRIPWVRFGIHPLESRREILMKPCEARSHNGWIEPFKKGEGRWIKWKKSPKT